MGLFDTGGDGDQKLEEILARLERVEEKLDRLLAVGAASGAGAGGPSQEALLEELRAFKQKGSKIQAIKRYREVERVGLKEAREYIDGVWHSL